MDIVEQLRDKKYPFCTEDVCYNESLMEDAATEIERLRQLVHELNSVAYVIDSQGVVHQSFTIIYKELE
jgi:hypothetical protein